MTRRLPRYLSEIVRKRLELERGQVHHLQVRHDEDCPFLDGHDCDCMPKVESGARVDQKHGGVS